MLMVSLHMQHSRRRTAHDGHVWCPQLNTTRFGADRQTGHWASSRSLSSSYASVRRANSASRATSRSLFHELAPAPASEPRACSGGSPASSRRSRAAEASSAYM